jgi:uncharacterized membrane protein YiaA
MHYIELMKVRPAKDAVIRSASWAEYQVGITNPNVSLPNGYTLTGIMLELPAVGQRMRVIRDTRNGVEIAGIYESTPVTAIKGSLVHTQNSVYLLRQQKSFRTRSTVVLCRF